MYHYIVRSKNAFCTVPAKLIMRPQWEVRLFYNIFFFFYVKFCRWDVLDRDTFKNVNFCGFVKVSPRPDRIEIVWIYVYVRAWCSCDKPDKHWLLLWSYTILSIRIDFSFLTYQSVKYSKRREVKKKNFFFFFFFRRNNDVWVMQNPTTVK